MGWASALTWLVVSLDLPRRRLVDGVAHCRELSGDAHRRPAWGEGSSMFRLPAQGFSCLGFPEAFEATGGLGERVICCGDGPRSQRAVVADVPPLRKGDPESEHKPLAGLNRPAMKLPLHIWIDGCYQHPLARKLESMPSRWI